MPRRLTRLAVRAGATALLAATCAVAAPNGMARAAETPAPAPGASGGSGSTASAESDSPASAGSDSPASSGVGASATTSSSAAAAGAGLLQVSGAGSVCAVPATSAVSTAGAAAVNGGTAALVAALSRAGGLPTGAADSGPGTGTPAPWASYLYLTSRADSAQSVGPAGATVGIGSAVVQPELAPSASADGPDWRPAGSLSSLIAFDATLSRESNPSGGGSAADYAARTSALQSSGVSTLAGLVSDWWNTDAGFRGTAAGQDDSDPAGAAIPAGSATTLLGIRYPTDALARSQYAVLPLVGAPVVGGAVGSRQLLGVLVVQHAVSAAPSLITPGSVSAVAHGVRDADFDALTVVDPMLESVDGVCAPADAFANAHPDAAVRAAISQDGRTLQAVAPSRLAAALNQLPAGDYQVSFTYTAFDGATVSSALPTTVTLTDDSPSPSPAVASASPTAAGASPTAGSPASRDSAAGSSSPAASAAGKQEGSWLGRRTSSQAALWSLALLGGAIVFAVLGVRVLRRRRH